MHTRPSVKRVAHSSNAHPLYFAKAVVAAHIIAIVGATVVAIVGAILVATVRSTADVDAFNI